MWSLAMNQDLKKTIRILTIKTTNKDTSRNKSKLSKAIIWNGETFVRKRLNRPISILSQWNSKKSMGLWTKSLTGLKLTLKRPGWLKIARIRKALYFWTEVQDWIWAIRLITRVKVKSLPNKKGPSYGIQREVLWVSCPRNILKWKKTRQDQG